MSTFWAYTLARLGLLLVAFGVLYVAGARGILLILLAFLVSALLSYWLLAGLRERLAAGVQTRAQRINERLDASAAAEDDDVVDDEPAHDAEVAGEQDDPGRPPGPLA